MLRLGTHTWYTLQELTTRCDLTRRALWRLVHTRQLRARLVRGRWHVRDDTWQAWCALEDSVTR